MRGRSVLVAAERRVTHSGGYRADIDGLRSYAVLAVLVYHLDFGVLQGGFLGVDVFFVISGFLITRWIVGEIEAGTFSCANFYARRVRRLFPAMFVTLALSFVAAATVFTPDLLQEFAQSLVYSILSVSNILFWTQDGYFEPLAEYKPLLHFWSLSVEEQFYFVWPVLLISALAVRRDWLVPALLAAILIISLYAGRRWLKFDADGAFYLAPFRAFEFAIGALMVWVVRLQPKDSLANEGLALAGLVLVAYPMIVYTGKTSFPGTAAILACIGAALLIHSGTSKYVGSILANRAAVGIGLISYSLYLVHWPIIVFYTYWKVTPITATERGVIALASISLAAVMYRFVELPFRRPADRSRTASPWLAAVCVALSALLFAPAVHAWRDGGWEWRPLDVSLDLARVAWTTKKARKRRSEFAAKWHRQDYFGQGIKRILVVGDSHGADFVNALILSRRSFRPYEVAYLKVPHRCQPVIAKRQLSGRMTEELRARCEERVNTLIHGDLVTKADQIVISSRWEEWSLKYLPDTLAALKQRTRANIVVLGRTMEFSSVPQLIQKHGRLEGIEEYVSSTLNKSILNLNQTLKTIVRAAGLTFADKKDLLCDPELICDVLDDQLNPLYFDYGHWTLEGAAYFGQKMKRLGWLAEVLDGATPR
jgi:peptidoglycan/LPS O-acetylase OafA/YrhL